MASVLGMLEEREAAARVRVEGLREEAARLAGVLEAAEIELDRRVIAREELMEVLAASAAETTAVTEAEAAAESVSSPAPVPGSIVPPWREGLPVTVSITGTIPVQHRPFDVAVTPDGTRALVARNGNDTVADVSLTTSNVTASVPVGSRPSALALSDDGTRAYAANAAGDSVSVIDTTTDTTIATVPVGNEPSDITFATPPATDLGLTLTATPRPGLTGRIDYTLTATNNGPGRLTEAAITADLPVPGVTSSDCAINATTADCTVTDLAPGTSATRHFSTPVALLSLGTPYTLTATRTTSSPADTNAANDTAARTCTALTPLLINCS